MNRKPKTPTRRLRRNRITLLLMQAGTSPSEVARLEGVTKSAVYRYCAGKSESARIQKRIEKILRDAGLLKKPLRELIAA
jgi:predicted transcriptional regulator